MLNPHNHYFITKQLSSLICLQQYYISKINKVIAAQNSKIIQTKVNCYSLKVSSGSHSSVKISVIMGQSKVLCSRWRNSIIKSLPLLAYLLIFCSSFFLFSFNEFTPVIAGKSHNNIVKIRSQYFYSSCYLSVYCLNCYL